MSEYQQARPTDFWSHVDPETFRPLHDRILVERIDRDLTPRSIILAPDCAQEPSRVAKVLCVGQGCKEAKKGDLVHLPGIAAKYPDWEQGSRFLIREADIGVVIRSRDN